MANYHVGQMVLLRSGKRGVIKQVIQDHTMAYLTTYQIAIEPSEQLLGVNGLDILDVWKSPPTSLDGYKLTGVTYGADQTCQICHGPASHHQIFETEISRAAAMEILAALMVITDADNGAKFVARDRTARFMFGVLIAQGMPPLVACSCEAEIPKTLQWVMFTERRFTLCGHVQRPVLSRGRREIADSQIKVCQVDNKPLCCAAPKLVDYANRHGYPMPYHMTEVWFDPNAFRRRLKTAPNYQSGSDLALWLKMRSDKFKFTEHGETRESCKTCKNLLPLLLCNARP